MWLAEIISMRKSKVSVGKWVTSVDDISRVLRRVDDRCASGSNDPCLTVCSLHPDTTAEPDIR